MDEFLHVLLLSALPACGNFVGGLVAEVWAVSSRTLSVALHAAAGIVIALVGIELMPQALAGPMPWLIVCAFLAGCGFFVLMDKLIHVVEGRLNASAGSAGGSAGTVAIYFAVSVDLFTDGVMIGTGSTVSLSLGLILALGQVLADLPEGFAIIANFKASGTRRAVRLLLAAAFAVPVFVGATIGYWALRDAADIYKFGLLAFTAGILLVVSIEEMMVEAHKTEDTPLMPMALGFGFGLFALVTVYCG